jgi:CheY-like chemotaxis protein
MNTPTESLSVKVLIVDDHPDHSRALGLLLRALGHEIATATDGPGGLRVAATFEPEIVFLDLQMPLMSGYQTARALRRAPRGAAARLILLTGADGATLEEARLAGCDALLRKPASLSAILAALHAAGTCAMDELLALAAHRVEAHPRACRDTRNPK